jgi:hypothetical protein
LESLKRWRHYFLGSQFLIKTDLKYEYEREQHVKKKCDYKIEY